MYFCCGYASAAYNPAFCNLVAGTLNIHWEATVGAFTGCTGIEFTNGTLADAADGSITMAGTGVSNPACIGTAAYTFTLSADRTQLVGADTIAGVPMTLTRGAGQACFVGTWSLAPNVYEAYIWAAPFPNIPAQVPASSDPFLVILAALLALSGGFVLSRRT